MMADPSALLQAAFSPHQHRNILLYTIHYYRLEKLAIDSSAAFQPSTILGYRYSLDSGAATPHHP